MLPGTLAQRRLESYCAFIHKAIQAVYWVLVTSWERGHIFTNFMTFSSPNVAVTNSHL